MGRVTGCCIQICLLVYLITGVCSEDGPKRSSGNGIIPFVRIGKSGNQLTSGNSIEDEQLERVVPTHWFSNGYVVDKRASNDDLNKGGLWFGPRLGRLQKRQYLKRNLPWNYLYLEDYTPRLGRENEDDVLQYNEWNA